MKPAAEMPDLGAGAQGRERRHERLLDDIFGSPCAVAVMRRRVQLTLIALDDRLEGAVIT